MTRQKGNRFKSRNVNDLYHFSPVTRYVTKCHGPLQNRNGFIAIIAKNRHLSREIKAQNGAKKTYVAIAKREIRLIDRILSRQGRRIAP